MKLCAVPPGVRSMFERWAASRKPTQLSFVPNGEGGLDLRLDKKLIGHMWIMDDDLHVNPARFVEISRKELRSLLEQALSEIP